MIYTLQGKIVDKQSRYIILEVGDIGFKVLTTLATTDILPPVGERVKLFCFMQVREDGIDLYGFLDEKTLHLFELFNTISGIGPRSALNILGVANVDELLASIKEGRSDLLSKASGVGGKTAERIILELKNKVDVGGSEHVVAKMESDDEVLEALATIGYPRNKISSVLSKLDPKKKSTEERFKEALKMLK